MQVQFATCVANCGYAHTISLPVLPFTYIKGTIASNMARHKTRYGPKNRILQWASLNDLCSCGIQEIDMQHPKCHLLQVFKLAINSFCTAILVSTSLYMHRTSFELTSISINLLVLFAAQALFS